jgi:hypothetical protein
MRVSTQPPAKPACHSSRKCWPAVALNSTVAVQQLPVLDVGEVLDESPPCRTPVFISLGKVDEVLFSERPSALAQEVRGLDT